MVQDTANTSGNTAENSKVETVTLTDGRVVEFAGKRDMLKSGFEADDGRLAVRLDFRNGQTRTFTLPLELLPKFAVHGAQQKLGDVTAGLKDIDDKVLAVDELIEQLSKGEWTAERESNGLAGTSILARALAELKDKPLEAIKTFLKDKTQAQKLALRANPAVKVIVDRLEAEKAANGKGPKVDTDALLGEI